MRPLRIGRRGLLLWSLMLSACTTLHPLRTNSPAGAPLSGRIAVHVERWENQAARSMSAAFELTGDAQIGSLSLSTPLGSQLAQAQWSPGVVTLTTPQGETRFASLDALTREVLGESIPVEALFDWLRGRPWPGAASTTASAPDEPGFEQMGWRVNLARISESWIEAKRSQPPAVTVRTKLDPP